MPSNLHQHCLFHKVPISKNLSTHSFFPPVFISSLYFCFIEHLHNGRSIAIPACDTQQPCLSCFNILSMLLSVWLAEESLCAWAMFVLANLLLSRRMTSVRQWKDWQDLKMWRTVLSGPTPAGKKEWGLLAGSFWQATGDGLSGGTSRPHKSALHFTCKWSQKIPVCLWTELCKTLKKSRRTLAAVDINVLRNTHRDMGTHGWTKPFREFQTMTKQPTGY